MHRKHFLVAITFAGMIGLIYSCDRDKNSPGWDYFPDMAYSNAYESYSANPNTPEGTTMLAPPSGTVPREIKPFPYQKTDEDALRAGKELFNPVVLSDENLKRGKEVFRVKCALCHGDAGDGKGFLFTSGKYPYPPASLINEKVKNKKDGEIYHNITVGFGVMGAYGSMMTQEDRWKTILYLRTELQKNQ